MNELGSMLLGNSLEETICRMAVHRPMLPCHRLSPREESEPCLHSYPSRGNWQGGRSGVRQVRREWLCRHGCHCPDGHLAFRKERLRSRPAR